MNIRRSVSACAAILGTALFSFSSHAAQSAAKIAITGDVPASQPVSFNVYLPLEHRAELEQLLTELHTPGSAQYHKWLTPSAFSARFALSAERVQHMEREFASFGLTATQTSPHKLHVEGTAEEVQAAFGARLQKGVKANGREALVAVTPLQLPSAVREAGAVVLAFASHPRMQVNSHRVAMPQNRNSQAGAYWFDDLKQAYSWPSYTVVNGKGTTIAVLINGGYSDADMKLYFGHEHLAVPKITVENIGGGSTFNPNADGSSEAELDIQQSAGMAPGADILLYSVPDLYDDSVVAGLIQAVEDNVADVLSMSFSGPELAYTAEYNGGVDQTGILRIQDDIFAQGNAQGITFVAASGDYGAVSIPPTNCFAVNTSSTTSCGALLPSVEFPASSPHVTGVGGTNLGTVTHPRHPNNLDSAYLYEEAFGDPLGTDALYGTTASGAYWASGGGDSIVFKKPAFQKVVPTGSKVRAVPDIALHMGGCPAIPSAICNPDDSSDVEILAGQPYYVVGTSASAPDFAGLTALNVEVQGTRLGNENYYIYALAAAQKAGLLSNVYRNRIPGYNGLYSSGNGGYNRVLGVGTPVGVNFLLIPNAEVAGTPRSPSNP